MSAEVDFAAAYGAAGRIDAVWEQLGELLQLPRPDTASAELLAALAQLTPQLERAREIAARDADAAYAAIRVEEERAPLESHGGDAQ